MSRLPPSWPDLRRTSLQLAGALALLAAAHSRANAQSRSFVEAQSDRQFLNAGYPAQLGMTLRGVLDRGRGSVWTVDAAARRAFLDEGVVVAVMNVRDLAPSPWLAGAGVSSSFGGFFLPRFRADAMVGHKWLARRQVVTTLSGRFVEAKDSHRDLATGAEIAWYGQTFVAQLATTVNFSQPGSVTSLYHRAAITLGAADRESLTLYGAIGREAYQLLAADSPIVDFRSGSFGGTWRRWMRGGWGATAGIERYENTAYDRMGITVGVMRRLPSRRASDR
jgi:YaiO family outer membrane protein